MDDIEFVSLFEVKEQDLIELMTNDKVGRQLPLLDGGFNAVSCRAFLKAKQQLWDTYGYGPWAFRIKGVFAGWGGLQPEQGDADFGLVLDPAFWGWGRKIFHHVKEQAFSQMNLDSITALLPPNRTNANAIKRLGFVEDGQVMIDGQRFQRFRLMRP